MRFNNGWIFSSRLDWLAFVAPVALSWLFYGIFAVASAPTHSFPHWAWMLGVVLVDGPHVWTTFYRTHLDPEEFTRRRLLHVAAPLACLAVAIAFSYLPSPIAFWRLLTYLAMFHFLRQQVGWMAITCRKAGQRMRAFDKLVIYLTAGFPMLWLQAYGNRHWFTPGDLVHVPTQLVAILHPVFWLIFVAYLARELRCGITGPGLNLPKLLVLLGTFFAWYVGWVVLSDPTAFYLTLILIHGVPYFFLIHRYGRERWRTGKTIWVSRLYRGRGTLAFYAGVVLIAYLWVSLLGDGPKQMVGPALFRHLIVPLWAVAQMSHFALDGFIWKFNRHNPRLAEYLGFNPGAPRSTAPAPPRASPEGPLAPAGPGR